MNDKELDPLEELWQIKQEMSSKFANVRDFCEALIQCEDRALTNPFAN